VLGKTAEFVMLYGLVRLFPLILLIFVGGCIQSSHDIAVDLPIELPKLEGIFVRSGTNDVVVIKPMTTGYLMQWGEGGSTFLRLFKVPEYSGYVAQMYDFSLDSSNNRRPKFSYFLAQASDNGLSFSVMTVDFDHLPANLRARVNVSASKNYMEPKDPSQTLEIIREAAKLNQTPFEYRRANSPPG
jgi:hypothetical protein